MAIDLSTFWGQWDVVSGNTAATNQYEFWKGMVMSNGQILNNQYEFFKYHNTTRYEWFKNLQTTYPDVWDEYTFYKNTTDPNIFDYRTFYQYGGTYLTGGGTTTTTTTAPPLDPDATAYLNAVTATGGTVNSTISNAVYDLFDSLKTAGIYSKLDLLMPMIGSTKPSMLINAIEPTSTTWGWTEYGTALTYDPSGIICNGTSALKSSFLVSDFTNCVDGSSHFGIYYSRTTSGAYFSGFLNTAGSPYGYFNVASWTGSLYGGQFGGPRVFDTSDTPAPGWWFAQRTAIDNASWYRNDVLKQNSTSSVTYLPTDQNQHIGLFALAWLTQGNGIYAEAIDGVMCTVTIGSSLTSGEKTDLNNIITTFNTALSRA